MKFDGLSRIAFAALTALFQQCGFGAVAVAKGFTRLQPGPTGAPCRIT